jgi:hypothetical protein
MMVIFPARFLASSSTEGASALQTSQVGAQNQKAAFLPTRLEPSNVPPPTSGLENASVGGTTTGAATDGGAAGAGLVAGVEGFAGAGAAVVLGAADAFAWGAVVEASAAAGAAGFVVVVEAPQAASATLERAKATEAERQRREGTRKRVIRVMARVYGQPSLKSERLPSF